MTLRLRSGALLTFDRDHCVYKNALLKICSSFPEKDTALT